MAINGTVQATGEFAPTSTGDTYAIIDARYMRDGFRNVDTLADLDNITEDRRIAGMVVGVSGGTDYYKLNQEPWLYDFSDWSVFNTGGGGGTDYWTSGSTGNYSIKTINDSSTDATGDYAISGGYDNLAIGDYSLTIGGDGNSVSGLRTAIIGGNNNTILSGVIGNSAIIGGSNNIILSGFVGNSAIIGGANNVVSGTGSIIIGGSGISGVSTNTVYVPKLNIDSNLLNDDNLTEVLVRATDGTIKYKSTDSFLFTGNTSGTCIANLYVTDIYGCSPVTINGATTLNSNHTLKVRNQTTELISVRDDGYTEFTKNGAEAIFGNSSNYLNHIGNRLIQFSNAATFTGFHADRNGTGISIRAASANNMSLVESTGTMAFSTGWNNNFNTNGNLAMLINGNSQDVGIGLPTNLTIPSARLHVRSTGTTESTTNQIWQNGTPTELARMTDSGGLCIGINTLSGGFANAARLRIDATVSSDYTNTAVFDQTYSQTGNNGNTSGTLTARLYKPTNFNTLEMKAANFSARNDGSGSMTYMYGTESTVWGVGAANINSAFAYAARCQIRAGNVTNYGGLDISYQENDAPAVVTNMIGVLVRSPVNINGITATNTYGVYVQTNSIATNNYGIVTASQNQLNGFGVINPTDMVHINGGTGNTANQFRLEQSFTPTSSGDTAGNVGSVAWDNNYLYTKTNTGWGRVIWDYGF